MPDSIKTIIYYTSSGNAMMRFACPACDQMTSLVAIIQPAILKCGHCLKVWGAENANVEIEDDSRSS